MWRTPAWDREQNSFFRYNMTIMIWSFATIRPVLDVVWLLLTKFTFNRSHKQRPQLWRWKWRTARSQSRSSRVLLCGRRWSQFYIYSTHQYSNTVSPIFTVSSTFKHSFISIQHMNIQTHHCNLNSTPKPYTTSPFQIVLLCKAQGTPSPMLSC